MIRTIGGGGINWNWYWCGDFDIDAKTVHVYYYERWHRYESDSEHPKAEWLKIGRIDAIETDNRTLIGLKLEGIYYNVINPKYIFDYKDFSHYVAE